MCLRKSLYEFTQTIIWYILIISVGQILMMTTDCPATVQNIMQIVKVFFEEAIIRYN
jgi:hypothetical protein